MLEGATSRRRFGRKKTPAVESSNRMTAWLVLLAALAQADVVLLLPQGGYLDPPGAVWIPIRAGSFLLSIADHANNALIASQQRRWSSSIGCAASKYYAATTRCA